MGEWVIEQFTSEHVRTEFSCGTPLLDNFLRLLVSQYERRGLGRTYVARKPQDMRVAGFYTLAAGSFDVSDLPSATRKKLPKHAVPTVHLGRLAVDHAFRGQRLGETLLFHALRLALQLSATLGAYAVDVWAIDGEAAAFYRKYGFVDLADDPLHLYLQMKSVEKMFNPAR
jgi:GNAT superfamily N-acetyltransferase